MNLGAPHQHCADGGDQPQGPVVQPVAVGGGQNPGGRNQQGDHNRGHALFKCTHHLALLVLVPPAGDGKRECGARQQNAKQRD